MTILAAVVLVLWVITLLRTILNLTLIPRLDVRPAPPVDGPLVSVIIPARNEARAIERTLRSFVAQTYRPLEVIIVNDRSDDETGAIARRIAAESPRVIVVDGVETPAGWLGKPWALQQGADRARGDLLIFVDADIRYAPDAVAACVDFMQGGGIALASLFPTFEMEGFWERVAMPNLAFAAFVLVPAWLSNRTNIAAMGIGGGCGNVVTRTAYDKIGQHHRLKSAVVDDVALARTIRRDGAGLTRIVRAEDLVAVRMYHGGWEIVEGFTKNFFSALNRSYLAAAILLVVVSVVNFLPFILAVAAFFGRVSRAEWMGIASLGLIVIVRVMLYRAMHYGFWNAVLAHPLFIAFWLYVTARSVWYTGIRRQLHWRGRTYDAARTRFGAE